MEIGITINNKLVYDQELSKKDILKTTGKVLLVTGGIVLTNSTLSYAATIPREVFKGEVNQGTAYILLRLMEALYGDEIIQSFIDYDNAITDILKGLGGAGIDMLKDSMRLFIGG